MSNLRVNKLTPYTEPNISVDGDLSISGSLIVEGKNEIVFNNSVANMFTNPKTITEDIILTAKTSSALFGDEITIDDGVELFIGEDSDLTIFNSDNNVNSVNNITVSTTISTIFTGNTSNDPISNLWVSGDVRANAFYGDGSNLTNLPTAINKNIGTNSIVQEGPIDSLSFGNYSTSLGITNQSNGDASLTSGINNITGTKQNVVYSIINGKYILFLEDVSNNFVTGNEKIGYGNSTFTTGTTTTTTTEVTYESEIIGGSISGCTKYILANNTATIIDFYYTDCESGITAQTSVMSYSTSELCSLTEPTYINYSWLSAYPFPASITPIGTCCESIESTTATTTTITTTIVTSATTLPFNNNCNTYRIINNLYPNVVSITYTSCTCNCKYWHLENPNGFDITISYVNCNGTVVNENVISGYSGYTSQCVLGSTLTHGTLPPGTTFITLPTDVCCNSGVPTNCRYWYLDNQTAFNVGITYYTCDGSSVTETIDSGYSGYTSQCVLGYSLSHSPLPTGSTFITLAIGNRCTTNGSFLTLTDQITTLCASSEPQVLSTDPNYINSAVTISQSYTDCCLRYNIYNPAFCPIVVYFTDCSTGILSATTLSGYLSIAVCSLTEPTFNTSCWSYTGSGYNPSIYSPVVTLQSINPSRCQTQAQVDVVIYSSVTSAVTYTITTGCTSDITYYTGATGCTNYIVHSDIPANASDAPLISYIDCLGVYQSFQINSGETFSICSSTYPAVSMLPGLTAFSQNLVIRSSGNCETICASYRFTKTSDLPIPPIWDVYYLDCDYNPQTVKLKRVGDYFETCLILGSQILGGPHISEYQVGICDIQKRQINVTSELNGGYANIPITKLTNATIYDGLNSYPVNVVNIETGNTTPIFTGITGLTILLTGFTGDSVYTILELDEELLVSLNTIKIASNYFGLASVSTGIETLAKGTASLSENINTKALGDYSHAEGNNTQSIGIGSHSEGLDTIAYGDYSHVEGYNNKVYGNYGSSKGVGNITGGKFYKSTFNGSNTITLDSSYGDLTSTFPIAIYPTVTLKNGGYVVLNGSTFNGTNTVLTIDLMSIYTVIGSCISVGEILISEFNHYYDGDQIIGTGSTSEGLGNKNFGNYSHVQGQYNSIFGDNSSAEGSNNTVFGCNSHANGNSNKVYGYNSYVGGVGNTAFGDNQHVIGTYNIENNNTSLFVVGNGLNDGSRNDVLRVDADKVKIYEVLNIVNINEYADNATALSNGLVAGDVYRTGEYLKIVY